MKEWLSNVGGTLVLFLLLLVVFPGVWFLLDKYNFPSILGFWGTDNPPSEWSVVFIGYYGSAFAAIAGYIAVILSLNVQNKARKEDNAKGVLPLLSIEVYNGKATCPIIVSNAHFNDANQRLAVGNFLKFQNVGMREMYNLEIINIESETLDGVDSPISITPILYKDKHIMVYLPLAIKARRTEDGRAMIIKGKRYNLEVIISAHAEITFAYSDCYENKYAQKFKLKFSSKVDISKVQNQEILFNSTIEQCEVINAPVLQS